MKKGFRVALVAGLALVGILATTGVAYAESPQIIEDGFVCPVLGGKAGMNGNSPKIADTGNFYTIIGPEVSVPRQATNGNNGTNNPGGPYASPGEENYTAIWPFVP